MSIDVATLVFEFKSDDAVTAEKRMDNLIAKGERLEAQQKKIRLATDRVNEGHRTATGAVERAAQSSAALARAAEREAAAWGRAEAALAKRNAAFRGDQALAAMRQEAAAAAALETRIDRLMNSVDPMRAVQSRLNAELAEASALYKAGAISASDYARAVAVLDQRMAEAARGHGALNEAQNRWTTSSGAAARAGLNLSRQFADIGVQIAGQTPLYLILIQQGPQIADAFAQAKMEGLGFSGAMRGLATSLGPVIPLLVAVTAAGTVVFGGAALAARALNQENEDLVAGLGLTERQLDRLKDKGVNTGVTISDVFRGTFNYIREQSGATFGPLVQWIDDLFDRATIGARDFIRNLVAGFAAGFAAIKTIWANLPAVMGDVAVSAANAVVSAIETMINKALEMYNRALPMIRGLMIATGNAAGAMGLGSVAPITLGRLDNPNAGAAAGAMKAADAAAAAAAKSAAAGVDKIFDGLGKSITQAAEDRIRKAAGDAGKTPKAPATPRDMSDERFSQVEGQIAQAMQDELQGRLALAREVGERASLEKQIAAAQLAEKQAQVDRQMASIADDKGLTDASKTLLLMELEAVKLVNARVAGLQALAIDDRAAAEVARQELTSRTAGLRNQMDLLDAQAGLTKSAFARAQIDKDILKLKQQEERAVLEAVTIANGYNQAVVNDAQARLAYLARIHPLQQQEIEQHTRLVDAISEASEAAYGFRSALERHDFARAFDELQRAIDTVIAAFQSQGLTGGLMSAGSMVASMVGGKTGRAIGGGLGIAAGAGALGSGLYAAGLAGAPVIGSGALSVGMANGLMALGSALPMIGLAAGALYAAAKIFNIGNKPTNGGAGYDLTTGALSGNKRTSETEGAVKAAGDAIVEAQNMLRDAGITLGATVNGLVIGTRDLSQIYLSNGKTLTSAVGDSAAAVDAALRGILDGATFQSDAQRKLVESTLAAGKGLDELAAALGAFEQAQSISKNLTDEILRLTDPKAFDLQAVEREIKAQEDAAKVAAAAGYLTADQLSEINAQLATLKGLKLNEVVKQYDAGASAATSASESAEAALMDAYNAFVAAKNAEIAAYRQTAESLRGFRRELDFGAIAGRDPIAQYQATKREFERLSAMGASNPERARNLQAVSQAFLEASKAASPTQLAFERDLNAVRRATEGSADAADRAADIAQAQLDAATAQMVALGLIAGNTMSMADALNRYLNAGAANDNSLNVAKYLLQNPDLAANWNAGGLMRGLGSTLEEAARKHYEQAGQYEIAAGTRMRGYAAGGDHPGGFRIVGEEGPEIEATGPSRIFSARESARMLGGDTSRLEALVEQLSAKIDALSAAAGRTAEAAESMDSRGKRQEFNGIWVHGETPDDPVQTAAA